MWNVVVVVPLAGTIVHLVTMLLMPRACIVDFLSTVLQPG